MLCSIFSIVWLVCGIIATLSMLSLLGGKPVAKPSTFKWIHRISGGLFALGYLAFLFFMIPLYQNNAPFMPATIAIHAWLGFLLLPLLLTKVLVARVFRKFYAALPYLGVAILAVAFCVVGFTGGHMALLRLQGPNAVVQTEGGSTRTVSVPIGRELLYNKCSRCHDLRPVFLYRQTETQWRNTVERMVHKDPALTSEWQADQIVGFLKHELGSEEESGDHDERAPAEKKQEAHDHSSH